MTPLVTSKRKTGKLWIYFPYAWKCSRASQADSLKRDISRVSLRESGSKQRCTLNLPASATLAEKKPIRGVYASAGMTKHPGTVSRFFQFLVLRRVRAAVPWSLDSSVAQTTKPRYQVKQRATHGPRNVPPSAWAVRLWLSRDRRSIRPPRWGKRRSPKNSGTVPEFFQFARSVLTL